MENISNNSQPIPEEVKEWIRQELEKYSIPLAMAGFEQGAEAMYRRLATEMGALREERDVYRKVLEFCRLHGRVATEFGCEHTNVGKVAKEALDQYPSPKNSDNGQ